MAPLPNIKIRHIFFNITCHESKFQIKAEWNFFATAHGKNVCDGLGGTLKRLVARASLQHKNVINTPILMYQWAAEYIKNMNFDYVEEKIYNDIKNKEKNVNIKPIPKTQTIHCVIPLGVGKVKVKYFSFSNEEYLYEICS